MDLATLKPNGEGWVPPDKAERIEELIIRLDERVKSVDAGVQAAAQREHVRDALLQDLRNEMAAAKERQISLESRISVQESLEDDRRRMDWKKGAPWVGGGIGAGAVLVKIVEMLLAKVGG